MAGDGVSLQTNITQLGNLAKSQSKAQQVGAVNPDQTKQLEKEDAAPLEKVRETEKAEKKKVGSQEERKRHRRQKDRDGEQAAAAEEQDKDADENTPAEPGLGGLVDTKA